MRTGPCTPPVPHILVVELRNSLSKQFGLELPPTLTFDYPTTAAISAFIFESMDPAVPMAEVAGTAGNDMATALLAPSSSGPAIRALAVPGAVTAHALAVTGISLRLAYGIDSLPALNAALASDAELQTVGPFHRWDVESHYSPGGGAGRVSSRFATFVHTLFDFDPELFGLALNEAAFMDPTQRLLLEETVAAFASAGRSPDSLLGSATGVYVGCIWLEYGELLARTGHPAGAYMVTGEESADEGGGGYP